MAQRSDVWSTFDLVEAFHLAHALAALHELDILPALAERRSTADALATRFHLDRAVLHGVLTYLAARTDIIRKSGRDFATTARYGTEARFLLDLYMGAFRPNAIQLPDILRSWRVGEKLVDRVRHARTFEQTIGTRERAVASVVRLLELKHLVDLGCGSGDLLMQLGIADRSFTGWGIEMNPRLCRAARARLRAARLTRRVSVIEGDSRRVGALLSKRIREQVAGVTACHVINEMFWSGAEMATAWLRNIRKFLPGRPVIINDYYGRLGTTTQSQHRPTLLHDYAQLISGQGTPPSTLRAWRAIYTDAGYRLVHVLEDRATTQFIHVIS